MVHAAKNHAHTTVQGCILLYSQGLFIWFLFCSLHSCYKAHFQQHTHFKEPNTTWFHIFNNLGKRADCSEADVRCLKAKWVNHRLLGANYVSQTMGLTELPNERYEPMTLSHNRLCVCLQRARWPWATAVLPHCRRFHLSVPCDSNASQICSCSTDCKTTCFFFILFF